MKKNKKRALVLFSGGLDSILSAKTLQEQGIEVKALIFKSYFWKTQKAEEQARKNRIPFMVKDFSGPHLKIVQKPKHGYGRLANPCLDCHILMLKTAKKLLRKGFSAGGGPASGWDFIATGEVIGQRPFSQNKKALSLLSQESGLNDLLLRPLSAKLLPISLPEKEGWVDRNKLYDIRGRGRKRQIELAEKFGLTGYPQPAGGCRLTEKEYSQKLFKLLKAFPNPTPTHLKLLNIGRHFWPGKNLLVIGRHHEDNTKLHNLHKVRPCVEHRIIIPKNFPGPSALILGKKITQKTIKIAKQKIIAYSPKAPTSPDFMIKSSQDGR